MHVSLGSRLFAGRDRDHVVIAGAGTRRLKIATEAVIIRATDALYDRILTYWHGLCGYFLPPRGTE